MSPNTHSTAALTVLIEELNFAVLLLNGDYGMAPEDVF